MEKRYDVESITPEAFEEMVKRSAGVYRYRRTITGMALMFIVVVSAFSGVVYEKVADARRSEREKEMALRKLAILPDTESVLVRVPVAVPVPVSPPAEATPEPVPAPEIGTVATGAVSPAQVTTISPRALASRTQSRAAGTRTVTVATSPPARGAVRAPVRAPVTTLGARAPVGSPKPPKTKPPKDSKPKAGGKPPKK